MEILQKEGKFNTKFLAARQSISPTMGFRTGKNTIHQIFTLSIAFPGARNPRIYIAARDSGKFFSSFLRTFLEFSSTTPEKFPETATALSSLVSKCSATLASAAARPPGARQDLGGPSYPRHPSQIAALHGLLPHPKSQGKCIGGPGWDATGPFVGVSEMASAKILENQEYG